MVVLNWDLNASSPLFWDQEADETLPSRKLSELMLLNRMDQIIDEPTHFPRDNTETCIDLLLLIVVLFNHLILDANTK